MRLSRNLLFLLFFPAFIILYAAANGHNAELGLVGIALVVFDAGCALVMKK